MTWKQRGYLWTAIMLVEVIVGVFVAWEVLFPLAFIAYFFASTCFMSDPDVQAREDERIDRWYWQVRSEIASKDAIAQMRAAELQRERWRRLKTVEKSLAVASVAFLYSLGLSIGKKLRW